MEITVPFFHGTELYLICLRLLGKNNASEKKICDTNNNCTINKIDNTLSFEIKDTILRKAALLKKKNETKRKKAGKGKIEQTRKKYKQQKIQKKGREG